MGVMETTPGDLAGVSREDLRLPLLDLNKQTLQHTKNRSCWGFSLCCNNMFIITSIWCQSARETSLDVYSELEAFQTFVFLKQNLGNVPCSV